MKQKELQHSMNYVFNIENMTYNDQPSEAVPNMATPMRDILMNFTRGQSLPLGHKPSFDGSDDFDDLDPTQDPSFDLADATAMLQDHTDRAEKIRLRKVDKGGLPEGAGGFPTPPKQPTEPSPDPTAPPTDPPPAQ